jgi:hypothetical protein
MSKEATPTAIESYRAAKMQVEAENRSEFFPGIQVVIGIGQKVARLSGFDFTEFEKLSLAALQKTRRKISPICLNRSLKT